MHLFWIQGPRRQARLRLLGSFFVIGRTEPFAIFQDDPSISREHAVVVATDDGVLVKDLGSSNGVHLNGRRLDRYAEVPLAEGDELVIGRTTVRLLGEGDEAEGEQVTVDRDGRSGPRPAQVADDPARTHGLEEDEDPPAQAPETDVGEILDDPEDLPGEETEELERPDVLAVDSDPEEDSNDEALERAPTEDEGPEPAPAAEDEPPAVDADLRELAELVVPEGALDPLSEPDAGDESAPRAGVSDIQLAEDLTELADLAEREPELE